MEKNQLIKNFIGENLSSSILWLDFMPDNYTVKITKTNLVVCKIMLYDENNIEVASVEVNLSGMMPPKLNNYIERS